EAISHFEAALGIDPNSPDAHVNLGIALSGIPGRMPEAPRHFEAALRIKLHAGANSATATAAGAGVGRARAAADGAGHESEVGVVRGAASAVRIGELRGVGCIYGLQPKLQADAL